MLSINNFFGIDLEKMPNHTSIYKGSMYNESNEVVKDYYHRINPNCENHYFDSLVVKVIGDSATNFIFDSICYSIENAVDIAFVIERDLFNGGKLKYMDYFHKHSKEFNKTYFSSQWEFDKATIELSRDNDELSLKVWSHYFYKMDEKVATNELPSDAIMAEDGIIEYKFGSNNYPQGCEILQNDKDYIKPLPIKEFTFRTIKIRVSATDERLGEVKIILENLTRGIEQTFIGARLNGAFVFVDSDSRIVFPMTELEDRKNALSGRLVGATIKGFDCDNLSTYIGLTFQVMTSIEKNAKNIINLPISELYGYRAVPEYLNGLIEQFKPTKNINKTSNFSPENILDEELVCEDELIERKVSSLSIHYIVNNKDVEKIVKYKNIHSSVVGFQYHTDRDELLDNIQIGTELNLVPEPTNPYDPQAIAVYWKETLIGYIPRTDIPAIAVNISDNGGKAYVEKIGANLIGISIEATFERLNSDIAKQYGEFKYSKTVFELYEDFDKTYFVDINQKVFLKLLQGQEKRLY